MDITELKNALEFDDLDILEEEEGICIHNEHLLILIDFENISIKLDFNINVLPNNASNYTLYIIDFLENTKYNTFEFVDGDVFYINQEGKMYFNKKAQFERTNDLLASVKRTVKYDIALDDIMEFCEPYEC